MSAMANVVASLKEDFVLAHVLYKDMFSTKSLEEYEKTFNTMTYLVPAIAEDVALILGKTVEEVAADVVSMIADTEKADEFLRAIA